MLGGSDRFERGMFSGFFPEDMLKIKPTLHWLSFEVCLPLILAWVGMVSLGRNPVGKPR